MDAFAYITKFKLSVNLFVLCRGRNFVYKREKNVKSIRNNTNLQGWSKVQQSDSP